MPAIDLLINSNIRAILARHWIDTEKLHFRTTGGTVRFHGVLARQGSLKAPEVNGTVLEAVMHEIRRIPGVQKVYFTGVEIEHRSHRVATVEDEEIHVYEVTFRRKPEAKEIALKRVIRKPA